jgi:hypothetical protein
MRLIAYQRYANLARDVMPDASPWGDVALSLVLEHLALYIVHDSANIPYKFATN